ncbi:MAG: hypothetical protein J6U51_09050 [Bacteroidales bacterium]|nr:hypothetical protein [Bacteroidales bacterium]
MNIIGKFCLWRNKQRQFTRWRRLYRNELRGASVLLLNLLAQGKDMRTMRPDIMRAMALVESCVIMGIKVSLNNEDGLSIYLKENMSYKNCISAIKWLKRHKKEVSSKYLQK